MALRCRDRDIPFPRRPLVMGILNINDDSFSADGQVDAAWALGRARDLIAAGADIVDVGAESARTNRAAISEDEEFGRLEPFLQEWSEVVASAQPLGDDVIFPPLLSINTWRPGVAGRALAIAGDILNDMSGLPTPENARIAAASGAALLIMHTQGEPKVAHTHVGYRDVVAEVVEYFRSRVSVARAEGLDDAQIILDPGIDFAKQRNDNLRLIRELEQIVALGHPVLLPVSRKTVIGDVLGLPDARDRDAGTVACLVAGMRRGTAIFRVHHVEAAVQVTRTLWRTEHGRD